MTHSCLLAYVQYTIRDPVFALFQEPWLRIKAEETDHFLPPNDDISTYA